MVLEKNDLDAPEQYRFMTRNFNEFEWRAKRAKNCGVVQKNVGLYAQILLRYYKYIGKGRGLSNKHYMKPNYEREACNETLP